MNGFPLVSQLLFLPNIVLEVQKGDFLSGIVGLVLAGHLRKPGHQLPTLLRDELGCFHCIDQQLKKIAALLHWLESFADAS